MNISQLLIEFGYTEIQILKILNTYPLNHLSEDKLYSNIVRNYNYLLEKGYSEKEVHKMSIIFPDIFTYSIEKLDALRNYLLEKGYSERQINKMSLVFHNIYGYSEKTLDRKRNYLLENGYTEEEINKMTITLPNIYRYGEDNLERKRNYFLGKGYSEKEINRMTIHLKPGCVEKCPRRLWRSLGSLPRASYFHPFCIVEI